MRLRMIGLLMLPLLVAATTQPATIALDRLLASVPATLRVSSSETDRHAASRNEWLMGQSKGKIIDVKTVVTMAGDAYLVGQHKGVVVKCQLTAPGKFYAGDQVEIKGVMTKADTTAIYSSFDLSDCTAALTVIPKK